MSTQAAGCLGESRCLFFSPCRTCREEPRRERYGAERDKDTAVGIVYCTVTFVFNRLGGLFHPKLLFECSFIAMSLLSLITGRSCSFRSVCLIFPDSLRESATGVA